MSLLQLQVSDPDIERAGHQELPVQHDPNVLEETVLHSEPFGKDIGMSSPMEQPARHDSDVPEKPVVLFQASAKDLELSWHEMLPAWEFPVHLEEAVNDEEQALDCHTRLAELREQLADLLDNTPGLQYASLDQAQVADVVRFSESLVEASWHTVRDLWHVPGAPEQFDEAKAKVYMLAWQLSPFLSAEHNACVATEPCPACNIKFRC